MKLNGDRSSELLCRLIEEHRATLLRLARGIVHSHSDAEDLLQEASLRMFHSFSRFRGESKFITWSGRIVMNVSFDHLRRKNKKRTVRTIRIGYSDWMAVEDPKSVEELREKLSEEIEQTRLLSKILSRLSPEHRQVLELRYLEGLSQQEVANILGIPIGIVGTRSLYARRYTRNGHNGGP